MRLIVGLILGGWALVAWAQFGLLPLLFQGIQATQGPSLGDIGEIKRQGAELQTLTPQIERLKRLGRFEEAEAADRRRFELLSSGALGRMIKQGQERGGNSVQGMAVLSMEEVGKLSAYKLRMERYTMEDEGANQVRALFIAPVQSWAFDSAEVQAQAKLPPEALRLQLEGRAHFLAKDYAAAGQSFEKAYLLSPSPNFITMMAQIDVLRGQGEIALRRLQAAIETLEKENPRSVMLASMLWQQASIQSTAGAHDLAAKACERALAIVSAAGETTPEYAAGQNNLGVALQLGGNTARALDHYGRSFGVLRGWLRTAPPDLSKVYQMQLPGVAANLGLAHWQLGDLARAVDSFRVALEERTMYDIQSSAGLTERAQIARAQAVAPELYVLMTLEQAANSKGLGLPVLLERKAMQLERRTRALAALRREAQVDVAQPNKAQARAEPPGIFGRLFATPVSREEAVRKASGRPSEDSQRADDLDLLREYDAVVKERSATPRTPANTARIADLDTRIQVMQVSIQTRDQLALLYKTREEIGEMQRTHPDPKKFNEAYLAQHWKQQQALEQDAKRERTSLLSRVQARVPQGAALIEMVRYRPFDPRPGLAEDKRWAADRYGAYVMHPEGEAQYIDLGEAGPLDKQIAEFRVALADPVRAAARDLARKLDETLMRPVRTRLGDTRTLYVAPDGALNLIPLGALVDETGSFLLERYTINYLASGRDLLDLGRNDPARGPAVIIADPVFDAQSAGGPQPADGSSRRSIDFRSFKFDRLPGTAAEAQALKRVFPDADVLTGNAATETAAKKIAGPRILHIATHGFFLEDLPGETEDPMLRSGLVFAGVNGLRSAEDDGVLTALEASSLDLRGTKLVVLSACETGLGEVKNGEGVFGLRRAFVVAGAETLLMSLWQVADEATKDLMTSYYSRLSRGESRSEALRQTQLAMLKDPKTAHPFFWAAFISSGETGNLK